MSSKPSVIVLAGGYSRRMGQDKALLVYRGQSLLARTIQVASQISDDVLLVTPWPERYQEELPDSVQYVTEQVPSTQTSIESSRSLESTKRRSAGPLSGFACGWQQVCSDWCLLLACDLPYLEVLPLKRWWHWIQTQTADNWPDDSRPCEFAQPAASLVRINNASKHKHSEDQMYWQPLCGYYHRSCLVKLEQREQKQRSFQRWLSTIPIAQYSDIPPRMLFNCNTPSDWRQVEADS